MPQISILIETWGHPISGVVERPAAKAVFVAWLVSGA
jgi:hypothetical protein